MLVEDGFETVSSDASDKMLKTAYKIRWDRRKEPAFDQWGKLTWKLILFKNFSYKNYSYRGRKLAVFAWTNERTQRIRIRCHHLYGKLFRAFTRLFRRPTRPTHCHCQLLRALETRRDPGDWPSELRLHFGTRSCTHQEYLLQCKYFFTVWIGDPEKVNAAPEMSQLFPPNWAINKSYWMASVIQFVSYMYTHWCMASLHCRASTFKASRPQFCMSITNLTWLPSTTKWKYQKSFQKSTLGKLASKNQ